VVIGSPAADAISHDQRQLRAWAAAQLRTAISEGRLQPGEWLRQERLARELGVSHMPVREALKELAAEGLVEYLPYRGMRVVEFTPDDIEDIYAMRALLEGRAAAAAAAHLTEDQIAELRTLLVDMAATMAPEQINTHRALNRRFHELIFLASGRAYLVRTLRLLWSWFPTMFLGTYPATAAEPLAGREANADEHAGIVAALAARDGARAKELSAGHILNAGEQLVAALRRAQRSVEPAGDTLPDAS
jgi:DNA-binding GntR family transcriptional regulator